MTVYRHARTGRWIAQVYNPTLGRKEQVGSYATKTEARAAERAAYRTPPSSRMTVAEWRERWLRNPEWRESTRLQNTERTAGFAAAYGDVRLSKVDRRITRPWVEEHEGTHSALSAMFGAAYREDDEHGQPLVTGNPFSGLKKRKPRRRNLRPDWLTAADLAALEDAAVEVHGPVFGEMMAGMIRFAAETAMRPGELYALQREDIDEAAGAVYVRHAVNKTGLGPTKNGLAREIVLTPQAAAGARRAAVFEDQSLAFVTATGKRMSQSSLSMAWGPVRTLAGRPGMHFYELRHYCCTRLIELGVSDADVAIQLGHTDGGKLVRSVYQHAAPRHALGRVRDALRDDEDEERAA